MGRTKMTKYDGKCATASRGVEAKEVIANARQGCNTESSSSPSLQDVGTAPAESSGLTTHASLDGTGSYVQVVVQKHRGERGPPASPRLPAASSPIMTSGDGAGDGGGIVVLPASVLLACPALAHHRSLPLYTTVDNVRGIPNAEAAGSPRARPARVPGKPQECDKTCNWKNFNIFSKKLDITENAASPERVEVYYFDRGDGAFLAAAAPGGGTRVGRAGRRAGRAGAAALAEAAAAARLLLAPPRALLVCLERCVLTGARDLATGAVMTASDYLVKPALALAFNACAAPVLVFAGNVGGALRDALRPVWGVAGDATAPLLALAAALARLSLVRVERRCACACVGRRCDAAPV